MKNVVDAQPLPPVETRRRVKDIYRQAGAPKGNRPEGMIDWFGEKTFDYRDPDHVLDQLFLPVPTMIGFQHWIRASGHRRGFAAMQEKIRAQIALQDAGAVTTTMGQSDDGKSSPSLAGVHPAAHGAP